MTQPRKPTESVGFSDSSASPGRVEPGRNRRRQRPRGVLREPPHSPLVGSRQESLERHRSRPVPRTGRCGAAGLALLSHWACVFQLIGTNSAGSGARGSGKDAAVDRLELGGEGLVVGKHGAGALDPAPPGSGLRSPAGRATWSCAACEGDRRERSRSPCSLRSSGRSDRGAGLPSRACKGCPPWPCA